MHAKILVIVLLLAFSAKAQDSLSKIRMEVHGFVKTDYWFDSRLLVQSREGLVSMYPLPVRRDALGNDLNGHPSFNFSAISTRVNLKLTGPQAFGATAIAFIEGDFTGMSNATTNTLRLRHAWINLQWQKLGLTMGQDWHPMFVTEVFPGVLALNTGAPFQPFIRNPQIRIDYKMGKMKLLLSAISQRDYTSNGPIGRDYSYLSNSSIPNLNAKWQVLGSKHFFGTALDWKSIVPRLTTDSGFSTSERLNSKSVMIFHKITNKKLELKSKVIYGENLTEHLMLGGYAVATVDSLIDQQTYTSTRHIFAWTNLILKIKAKKTTLLPGIFMGYAQNLGTLESNLGRWYATGFDIDRLFRISPSFSVVSNKVMLTFEYEFMRALYGQPDSKGLVLNTKQADNHRFEFSAFYLF